MRLAFRWLLIVCLVTALPLIYIATRKVKNHAILTNSPLDDSILVRSTPASHMEPSKKPYKPDPPPTSLKRVLRTGKRPVSLSQELRRRKTLFVGVVTAKDLLETRARAIYETWGREMPKIAFFSSEGTTSADLPIVALPAVDDTYPPQKKVFTMLKYIHDHFIDDYDWFMRADDDLYVRPNALVAFLDTIDSGDSIYMGQPGFGREEDRRRLKLETGEVYCMGGPGVFYSRALLKRLRPHIDECMKRTVVSYNEDVEVGRCISRRVGRQCTWSYELERHFFNDFSKAMFTDRELKELRKHRFARNAVTLHPIKQPDMMRVVHQFFQEFEMEKLEAEQRKIQVSVAMWKERNKAVIT
ncbi:chondroitin sulfate synthase 1-like [Oscarella lobularis]|uniref:chondroitin sulfate synthase 1-like n=1 Tax=Oscarella lobularis TaxID=121494 RepID=UPI003313FB49